MAITGRVASGRKAGDASVSSSQVRSPRADEATRLPSTCLGRQPGSASRGPVIHTGSRRPGISRPAPGAQSLALTLQAIANRWTPRPPRSSVRRGCPGPLTRRRPTTPRPQSSRPVSSSERRRARRRPAAPRQQQTSPSPSARKIRSHPATALRTVTLSPRRSSCPQRNYKYSDGVDMQSWIALDDSGGSDRTNRGKREHSGPGRSQRYRRAAKPMRHRRRAPCCELGARSLARTGS